MESKGREELGCREGEGWRGPRELYLLKGKGKWAEGPEDALVNVLHWLKWLSSLWVGTITADPRRNVG